MTTKKDFYKYRPRLRAIAPLTYWICAGFGIVNIAIAYLLTQVPASAIRTNAIPIVNEYATYTVWGIWFLLLSAVMFYALHINNWKLIKRALIGGLVTKLMWSYALLYIVINGGNAVATLILWMFIAYIQAWTIVFFVPSVIYGEYSKLSPEDMKHVD